MKSFDRMEPIDGNKQYSLRWEKHAFNLATEAGCFFEDESFLDCTLSAEGQCIDAHKIILSASSSYLSSLLKLMPDKHPILIFNDMKFEQLKSLVAFIYNGSVNISENDIHAFLNAAQSLLIKGLYEEDPKDNMKPGDHMKKNKKSIDGYDDKRNNHKFHDRMMPTVRTPELLHDPGRIPRKDRPILPKGGGGHANECEDSLFKLQEISFTKYINQNLNAKPANRNCDDKWNESGDDKSRGPDNYVVKSWKHNSVDDLNGRHKQNKSNFMKKLKLEKANPHVVAVEQNNQNDRGKESELDKDAKNENKEPNDTRPEDKIKNEDDKFRRFSSGPKEEPIDDEETPRRYLIEPKEEVIEEDDTNSENYEKSHTPGMEGCANESDNSFDNRSMPGYYHHPAVETGIPMPLLICKTSLGEPDSIDSNWMPQVNSSISLNHSSHQQPHNDSSHDMQCRTCTHDLPCPTCTKKYKSRYALNRHILYECGKARKSFTCDECGKKVTRQDTLQKHKLIHLVQHLKEKERESKLRQIKPKKKC